MRGIEYLRRKLSLKRTRVLTRYMYYDMKNHVQDLNATMPAKFAWLSETLGWSARAVDAIADRSIVRDFSEDNFNFSQIYNLNNRDILFDSAILGACIASCSFIYISRGEDGFPRLQVIDGSDATGVIDPVTYLLQEGYAVLERDDKSQPTIEAYFEPHRTTILRYGEEPEVFEHAAPYPLLVPIIYRPDAERPFGHSRITRACIGIQQAALRTMKRAEVSAEFYSFPQKYVIGLSDDAEEMDTWRATVSTFLRFDKDEDGDKPQLGQFTQQSMTPYVDQIRMFAGLFAGETGLTLDDLGFPSQNPSSSEAIKASHETLRLTARKAQRIFGTGFINAGYLAACVRDDQEYLRNQIYQTRVTWMPIFEPDAAAISVIGDGLLKIQQAFPEYLTEEKLLDLLGL